MFDLPTTCHMEKLGDDRKRFSLSSTPPVCFSPKGRREGRQDAETPIFEPYPENLPLQSGYYTFVVDQLGRFRVKWGNTSAHAAMVKRQNAGSAGTFRVSRIGKVAEVFCKSYDYRITCRDHNHRVVGFTIDSFVNHPGFDVSEFAVFEFSRGVADTFVVDRHRKPLDPTEHARLLELLEREGTTRDVAFQFNIEQIKAFQVYRPHVPPRLYPMRLDQQVIAIEDHSDLPFEYGPTEARLALGSTNLQAGKNNFVIDREGWLILGLKGHHILSGGQDIGGAGHVIVGETGRISEIHLNFSGHYRPPLDIGYIRYAFRTIANHPLLALQPNCIIRGRAFDELTLGTCAYRFDEEDLFEDSPELDEKLERLLI